jgi:hypothetical protein
MQKHIVAGYFPLGNFASLQIPDFQGLTMAKFLICPLVKLNPEVVQAFSPLMESWLADFNLIVPFAPPQ